MSLGRLLGVGLFLAPLAGCVLLVPDFTPKEHCTIAKGSTCSDCLVRSCQAPYDNCCGAASCREGPYSSSEETGSFLAAVDSCAQGSTSCASSLTSSYLTKSPESAALLDCLANNCHPECAPSGTLASWTCGSAQTETNACATCIYTSCDTNLKSCCSDVTCKSNSTLERYVSSCVGQSPATCATTPTGYQTDALADKVYACVAAKCSKPCFGGATPKLDAGGQSTFYCSAVEVNSDPMAACQCGRSSFGSADITCSASSIGHSAQCLASADACSCGHYGCSLLGGGGCQCSLLNSGTSSFPRDTTCEPQSGERCCVDPTSFSCTCSFSACKSGAKQVDSCSLFTFDADSASGVRLTTGCND